MICKVTIVICNNSDKFFYDFYHVSIQHFINSNQLSKINVSKLNSKQVSYLLKTGVIIICVCHEKNIKLLLDKFKTKH